MFKNITIIICFLLLPFYVYTIFYIFFIVFKYKKKFIFFFKENFNEKINNYSSDKNEKINKSNSVDEIDKKNFNSFFDLEKKEKEIDFKLKKLNELKERIINRIFLKFPEFNLEKIKNSLLILFEKDISKELEALQEKKINYIKKNIESISSKIICSSLEKYSSKLVFSKTVSYLKINEEDKGIINRIIGKGGRNIDFFNKVTGTKIIINGNESSNSPCFIQISSFNTIRRKIAENTLKLSIEKSNFSPMQIEKNFKEVESKMNIEIKETGEKVIKELGLKNFHEELVKKIGILEYRTSYGQNVLEHSIEVAKLCGSIASELGLNKFIARRAGLLHDIGKASDDNDDIDHVSNGFNLAKKCNESPIILNAISSHHKNEISDNLYSLIVIAADKLSAARPGSRGYQMENYIERMKNIEKVVNEISGVKQCYAFQAGREI